ncbi:MAG TPA: hypothetical protein VGO69_05825 [Pyrinomonadaceae bacterium]|nr:hypothetical protein [Pyrinomonadaceae bacterium]
MSEETPQNLPDGRSFEERVFARFDAMDARFNAIDARLNAMDARLSDMDARLSDVNARLNDMDSRLKVLEQKSYDTKPIWERALAEIQAVSEKIDTVERKLGVLGLDMLTLRADQTRLEARMDKIESKPAS